MINLGRSDSFIMVLFFFFLNRIYCLMVLKAWSNIKVLVGLVSSEDWEGETVPGLSPSFWWFSGNLCFFLTPAASFQSAFIFHGVLPVCMSASPHDIHSIVNIFRDRYILWEKGSLVYWGHVLAGREAWVGHHSGEPKWGAAQSLNQFLGPKLS